MCQSFVQHVINVMVCDNVLPYIVHVGDMFGICTSEYWPWWGMCERGPGGDVASYGPITHVQI